MKSGFLSKRHTLLNRRTPRALRKTQFLSQKVLRRLPLSSGLLTKGVTFLSRRIPRALHKDFKKNQQLSWKYTYDIWIFDQA